MALFHRATITPTKAELIADWAPTQAWGPPAGVPIEVVGSYRFDDPDGRVGMGQGEALGMAVYEGRWYIAPSNVRIQGGAGRRIECRSTASGSSLTTKSASCSRTTGSS